MRRVSGLLAVRRRGDRDGFAGDRWNAGGVPGVPGVPGGEAGRTPCSTGSANLPKLSEGQFAGLSRSCSRSCMYLSRRALATSFGVFGHCAISCASR
jgi:hypothetical protein